MAVITAVRAQPRNGSVWRVAACSCVSLIVAGSMPVPAAAQQARAANAPIAAAALAGAPVTLDVRPIDSFSRANPFAKRFGRLEFLGGLVLASDAEGFGGWSDLVIDADGGRVLMVSDDGHWLTARFTYNAGRLAGLDGARMGPLTARSGRVLGHKREADAEGLALLSGTLAGGEVAISFERIHRVGRFRIGPGGLTGPLAYLPMPDAAKKLAKNSGIEAVALLKAGPMAGALVVFAERRRKRDGEDAGRQGWLIRNGRTDALTVADRGGLDISGATGLPDGSLVLLERHFSWTTGLNVRLRRIPATAIRPGAVLDGDVLLEADLTNDIDNMEGVTAHVGRDGRTVLTLVSDDNFRKALQRTLVLQFAIVK